MVGVGSAVESYGQLQRNMNQPTEFRPDTELSLANRQFIAKNFTNSIKWRLGRWNSEVASCPDKCPSDCGPNEAAVWGYMYNDQNRTTGNGVREYDDPGLTDGSITINDKYRINPGEPDRTYDVVPDISGCWQSQCIKMSGQAITLTATIPSDATLTQPLPTPSYILNDKITGQNKKVWPRRDFGAFRNNPKPTIYSISPSSDKINAHTSNYNIFITGTDFINGCQAEFNGIYSRKVTFYDRTQIMVTLNAADDGFCLRIK